MKQEIKKIICPSCGGEFEDSLPKCPYCDTLHIKGAEAEYMEKLEDVREDMAGLGAVPKAETKKEFKKQGKFLGKIFVVVAILVLLPTILLSLGDREDERDVQADYLWKQENFPIMDELYTQGKYDELRDFYIEALVADTPVSDWEHIWFCYALDDLYEMELFWEQNPEELWDGDYASLLYCGWRFKGGRGTEYLTAEEVEVLTPPIERALEKFDAFWQFDEKDLADFEKELKKNDGHISYDFCSKYVKKWRKK